MRTADKRSRRSAYLSILTGVVLFLELVISGGQALASGATITVNSTADTNTRDNTLTLREALLLLDGTLTVGDLTTAEAVQVEGTPGTDDTILFDTTVFPPSAPATISVMGSSLPSLSTGGDTIDGSNAGVIVDGSVAQLGTTCFAIKSNGNTIKGLQISNFSRDPIMGAHSVGIVITNGAENNIIGGNRMVGSGPTGEGNVISGIDEYGVLIVGTGTDNNVVIGNFIGTDVSGTTALGNVTGVCVGLGAQYNTIGGITPGERNIISGSFGYTAGVVIAYPGTNFNKVIGNYIGTDVSGTSALGVGNGVSIQQGAQYNTVGGTTAEERNVISGNHTGVQISEPDTMFNTVSGNYIGIDATGTAALGNWGQAGMYITNHASYNTIGGATAGERNIVSANAAGISFTDGPNNNQVMGNFIGTDASGTVALGNTGAGLGFGNKADNNLVQDNLVNWNACGLTIYDGSSNNQVIDNDLRFNQDGTVWTEAPGSLFIDAQPVSDGLANFFSGNLPNPLTSCAPNQPPSAQSGGPYSVSEGASVTLNGSGSDPDGDPLTFAWDLDNDGTFETPGQSVPFSAAELDGPSSHTVTLQVADNSGMSSVDETTVEVENVAPTVGEITASMDPVQVDMQTNTSADFTDPGVLDTHTAVWDWGNDTTSPGTVEETNGSGSVSGSYTFSTPGVYAVGLTVTDKDGASDQSVFQFVVVYDPSGGFVTGGGWIGSPEGAYAADPTLTGKATFGFVSKYKKGADAPTGETEFQFHVANLNFHSDSYDWLVVAGHKAMYKGVGTINGTGNYGFMLSAIDEKLTPSTDVDLFRIKIWDRDNGDVVVYDNQMDAEEDGDPTTAIGGGSIVIHKAK